MRKSNLRHGLRMVAVAVALQLASAAQAATYFFSLTGPNTASFQLESSPTPAATGLNFFSVLSVPGTYNGAPTTFSTINFFSAAGDGGLSLNSLFLGGTPLFTGTLANPTFKLGTFGLTSNFQFNNYSLSITSGAVPEPGTWAMMLAGFAGMGLALRRRKFAVARLA